MTRLLVDIGNSRVKYAIEQSGSLSDPVTLTIDASVETHLRAAWAGGVTPDAVIVANVGDPDMLNRLTSLADELGWPSPVSVRVRRETSRLRVGYDDPDGLGVDRWLGMLGARWSSAADALVVIDAGTAVTLDAVTTSGNHLGGGIVPGLTAMREALPTPIRPVADRIAPQTPPFPATNTRDAIDSATLLGLADLITGLRRRLAASLDAEPTVFVTGGDAPNLAPFLGDEIRYEPALVVYGLMALVRETDHQ